MVAVSLMPAPVPDHEAEANAENNYMWPEAVEEARAHQGRLMVTVLGKDAGLFERGKLFVKVMACCCKQKYASGVYTSGTVFEPRFYQGFAEIMKEDEPPIFNWIWFGLYRTERGVCSYIPTAWMCSEKRKWKCSMPMPSLPRYAIFSPVWCPMCWNAM